jgi:hypothetical protein
LIVRRLAEKTPADDTDRLSLAFQVLMMGSVMAAAGGDAGAALRAREVAMLALAGHGIHV